jgi:hypothetical protein
MRNQFDLLWKAGIEEMPTEAISSLMRKQAHLIDFTRPPEFLDKELRAIINSNKKKLDSNNHADFLVRVWMKDGQEQWILIHIEVQSQPQFDGKFEERMYLYYVRIKQKYKCAVASLAVLADGSKKFKPKLYQESCLDTHLSFAFPYLKIMDLDADELRKSENPFDVVLLCVHLALKAGKKGLKSLDLKLQIVRHLFAKGFSAQERASVYAFIRYFIRLDDFDEAIFVEQFDKLEEIPTEVMSIHEVGLMIERSISEEKGKAEGKVEGKVEGKAEGETLKTLIVVKNSLAKGFSTALIAELVDLSEAEVLALIRIHQIG